MNKTKTIELGIANKFTLARQYAGQMHLGHLTSLLAKFKTNQYRAASSSAVGGFNQRKWHCGCFPNRRVLVVFECSDNGPPPGRSN